jgi:small-conductance mechanosensitive channel
MDPKEFEMDVQRFTSQLLSWLTQPLVKLGSSSISLGTLVGLGFIVLVWWLVSFVERTILRVAGLRAREVGGAAGIHMLSRVVRYLIWIVGSFVALNAIGLNLTTVALLGSALAVGLGFGLQNIFANFVGSVVILAERILKVGDFVELESGVRGNVKEVAMRYTRITTNDALDILVPNAEFTDGRVINWTYDNAFWRVRVPRLVWPMVCTRSRCWKPVWWRPRRRPACSTSQGASPRCGWWAAATTRWIAGL